MLTKLVHVEENALDQAVALLGSWVRLRYVQRPRSWLARLMHLSVTLEVSGPAHAVGAAIEEIEAASDWAWWERQW